jgi:hypothetical protein
MNYKPDEKDWMAYLYGELDGETRERMDQYLKQNPEANDTLENFLGVRRALSSVKDKEVIAPPIFVENSKQRFLWNSPYLNMIISIAASLLLIILVGKLTDAHVNVSGSGFSLSFGTPTTPALQPPDHNNKPAALTADQVQQMINASLTQNNTTVQTSLQETQQKLDASIRKNLAVNSGKIDHLVRDASTASQQQIREYVSNIQTQNMQMVKDYFQLTSVEQKKYVENLLIDFAQYLQQQRNSDLQVMQTRLNSIEQNTDIFKQETEQILTSIITSVGNPVVKENKN